MAGGPGLQARQKRRFAAAFRTAERDGVRLLVGARTIALLAIGAWILATFPPWAGPYYASLAIALGAPGFALGALSGASFYRPWFKFALAGLDAALLTAILLLPNPFEPEPLPAQLALRFGNFLYFFVFLAGAALTTSPALVLWTGVANALAWTGGAQIVAALPTTAELLPMAQYHALPAAERVARFLQPTYLDMSGVMRDAVVMLVVAAMLSFAVRRARSLVARQAQAERERAKLARYFSPALVDELSEADGPLREVRKQPAAVLFADIRGFTKMVEDAPPEAAIDLLRAFHARMEPCVFRYGDTLDKYIGDAVMAVFGAPVPDPRAAANALACGRDMLEAIAEWNLRRAARGLPSVRIGVGAQYGPVVLGDIGGERRLELTVIGDTVNVAARLERLTRDLDVGMVVGESLARAAEEQAGTEALRGFGPASERQLRGRDGALAVRAWRRGASSPESGPTLRA